MNHRSGRNRRTSLVPDLAFVKNCHKAVAHYFVDYAANAFNRIEETRKVCFDDLVHILWREVLAQPGATFDINENDCDRSLLFLEKSVCGIAASRQNFLWNAGEQLLSVIIHKVLSRFGIAVRVEVRRSHRCGLLSRSRTVLQSQGIS